MTRIRQHIRRQAAAVVSEIRQTEAHVRVVVRLPGEVRKVQAAEAVLREVQAGVNNLEL